MTEPITAKNDTEPVVANTPGTHTQTQGTPTIDPFKWNHMKERMRGEQNLSAGILGGLAAAAVGAAVWSLITVLTNFQIGWMAVGIGFLVGWAVRRFGRGVDRVYGYVGAVLSLVGCTAGNLLSACVIIARQENTAIMDVVSRLTPRVMAGMLIATFHPMDALFYGIAIYWGYRYAFRRLTEQDVAAITT